MAQDVEAEQLKDRDPFPADYWAAVDEGSRNEYSKANRRWLEMVGQVLSRPRSVDGL